MKRLFRLATATALTLGLAASLQPAFAADAYKIDQSLVPGTMGLDLVDSFSDVGEGASFIVATTPRPGEPMPDEHLCQGFGAAPCDFSNGVGLWGSIVAPACIDAKQTNCIESLSVYKDGEQPALAKLVRQSEGDTIKADPTHNLTEGSTKSLWSASLPHSGGTSDYVAYVALGLTIDPAKKFHVANLTTSVMPVNLSSGAGQTTRYKQSRTPEGREQVGATGGSAECVWSEANSCGKLQDFAEHTRVKLSVRVENTIGGWFKGRMKSPNIEVKAFSSSSNLIGFDAEPVAVPQFFARFDVEHPEPGVAKWLKTLTYTPKNAGTSNNRTDDANGFEIVNDLRDVAKDTAAGVNTLWTAGTVMSGGGSCLTDHSRVLGIVTTNSMVYQGDAPKFDAGTLNYKVGGLHFLPGGKTEVEGTYDLVMRSETARCLYGFSKAPISATISVTSTSGESKVASTIIKETPEGWLKLAAYGFTFSENKISAKITQATAAGVKKTTITCFKAKNRKISKQVTGISPKCPAGYVK